ncbi:MAG TPA: PQQ-binding-like beta-propeller repeat protein [Opitutaceae bacterium]|nr:PQQ-binding-like beta-propeller repeat protein [Opitutaceae bacterium]
MLSRYPSIRTAVLVLAFIGCLRAERIDYQVIPAAKPQERTISNAWPASGNQTDWSRSLGGPTSNRFSALDQINESNVGQLKVAWTYHSQDGMGNLQANPIVVGDTLYAPTAGHHIVALDAATGREKWRFKPEKLSNRLDALPARRGLLYWAGDRTDSEATPRLIFTAGNWVYVLDPATGVPVSSFGEKGRAPLPTGGGVTGAVWNRILVVPGFTGDVFGYDVVTGKSLWRFHTMPKPGEFGAETWKGQETGANCWGGMSLDESRGIAYVTTGSPKPNFIGVGHLGQNLFSNCILAIDVQTGKRLWHFQEIPHDIWDLDLPAPPNLVTVTLDGKKVDAVAQVTKIGNTLLLDRVTGKPLFPFRLRRAPESTLPGEETWPYQPDVELPEPFAKQEFRRDEITERTPEARAFVEQLIARANMGWFTAFEAARPTVFYGLHGGAEWTGAAVDPRTAHLYVSSNHLPWMITIFRDDDPPPAVPATRGETLYQTLCAACHAPDMKGVGMVPPLRGLRHRMESSQLATLLKTGSGVMPPFPQLQGAELKALSDFLLVQDRPAPAVEGPPKYAFGGYRKLLDHEEYPGVKPPWGTLNCIDLNTGRIVWRVPLGEYAELTAAGIPKTGTENFGGAIVTAGGVVFCSGTRDRKIRAFSARTGQELWEAELPLHGTAPPTTYAVDGRQFLVIAATGGGKLGGKTGDAWVAFALPSSSATNQD